MFNPRLAEQQLVSIYKAAYFRLYQIILEKQARGNATAFFRSLLSDTDRILSQLDEATVQWARSSIPKMYRKAILDMNMVWTQAGRNPPQLLGGFQSVHRQAVEVLAQAFVDNMQDATQYVGRNIRDVWRQTTLDVLVGRETTGETLREAKENFVHRIGAQGIESFRDKLGREWRLDAYADMAIRSTGREVTNTAQINQIRGTGSDLIQFTSHENPCEICAPLEGRVYSISGNDERFPPLGLAFSEGYANIHPNCIHSLRPYVEDFDDNPAATRRESNRSFERDPRSQAEKERYEAIQKENARKRSTRKQWEEYKAWMPDEMPSLAAFTRMKSANSERYLELQSDFREVRQSS